jgi:hypothetical protein
VQVSFIRHGYDLLRLATLITIAAVELFMVHLRVSKPGGNADAGQKVFIRPAAYQMQ